jgi:hypothetical protein
LERDATVASPSCYEREVDAADHYAQLARLGLDAFVAAAAPAALVRRRRSDTPTPPPPLGDDGDTTTEVDADHDGDTMVGMPDGTRRRSGAFEIFPLAKKPGAPFPDMITVGRTPNNDVVLRDATVSRLHAFFRQRGAGWLVADAGSKNGSQLDGVPLEPRKERAIGGGQLVRIGDLELTFYTAAELFRVLAP